MRTHTVKLVAALLLVVQALIGVAPIRGLCFHGAECGTHSHEHQTRDGHAGHGHDHGLPCGHEPVLAFDQTLGIWGSHAHGLFDLFFQHHHEHCGRHVHVPIAGDQQAPPSRQRQGEDANLQLALTPILAAALHARPYHALCASAVEPPDFSVSGQVRGLRATRLLI